MKYALLILPVLFIAVGCTNLDVPPAKVDILRNSEWKLKEAFIDYNLNAYGPDARDLDYSFNLLEDNGIVVYWRNSDNSDSMFFTVDRIDPACADDDIFVFRAGNEGAVKTGDNRCTINETAEILFNWGITNGGDGMYIYDAKEIFREDVNAEILEFYDNEFTIRYPTYEDRLVSHNGKPATWVRDTITYTMQFVPIN